MNKILITILGVIIVFLGGTQVVKLGAAPGGQNASTATSSEVNFGTVNKIIFATSTNCVSRVITSDGSEDIRFKIEDEVPSATEGHRVASTSGTTVYDSGVWGCGAWRAISTQNMTATVTEFTSFR